jgi:TorA maturation chaperone TorD
VLAAPPAIDVYTASYDLLARLYLDGPAALKPDHLPPTGPLLDALRHLDTDCAARVEHLLSHHERPGGLERAEADYVQSCVLPVPGRYVPPYASVYLEEGLLWGESTFKIQRLYATEGLSWQRAGAPRAGGRLTVTAPDHVGVEFAFLALATSRPRRGPAEGKRQQRLTWFLADHLDRWLPAYRDALIDAGAGELLEGFTAWAVDLVHADVERRVRSGR